MSDVEIDQWVGALPSELPANTRRAAGVIARALRDYGWFVTDTTGSAHLQFEDRATEGEDWDRLGLGVRTVGDKNYPRDSDQYPSHLRARDRRATDAIG